jgi:peptidoglycan/xylan/chitin deacetylase (PgdA/CDA1 family)
MDSWTECKSELKPLVARGQIQLANHTSSHPYLTQLSAAQIQKELMRAHNFIEKEYEVDARPYFRPPYGSISRRVIEAAAEVGYTKPVLWTKTLGDANKNSSLERISQLADSGFEGQAIVLSHANGMLVTRAFPHIMKQIESKDLKLLTVADVFTKGF